MNYRDFFKNKKATAKDIQSLIPEGVDQKQFNMGIKAEKEHTDDEFTAAKIAGDHLKEDPKYYTKLSQAGLEEEDMEEHCGACEDDLGGDYDDNGGLPKIGGALAIPHRGQPIMMGKIIQVGSPSGTPATGELSGMTGIGKGVNKDRGGVPANQPGDKEPLTAGGKKTDSSIATKTVGGAVTPGEGQKQGGPNSQGTIASTSKMNESKTRVRQIVKEVLKEITFDKKSGKWVRLNEGGHKAGCTCGFCKNKGTFGKKKKEVDENVGNNLSKHVSSEEFDKISKQNPNIRVRKLQASGNEPSFMVSYSPDGKVVDLIYNFVAHFSEAVDMKMGPSYKTVQPRMYDVIDDDRARTNQYDPEITEMYDDEEECMMNERYVELANAQRNLTEDEIAELKTLREKIDNVSISKRNFGAGQGGVEPSLYEDDKWIQKAVKPSHKGYCTPMTKSTCTPHRKALAKRFKSGDLSENDPKYNDDEEKRFLTHAGKEGGGVGNENPEGCYYCGSSNHHSQECPERPSSGNVDENRCEDWPACGHEAGDCPDSEGRFTCVGCGRRLPRNASSSICPRCQNRMSQLDRDDPTGQDSEAMFGGDQYQNENTVNMKMGPSYKVASPQQARCQQCDQARTIQYDPEMTESGEKFGTCKGCGRVVDKGTKKCPKCRETRDTKSLPPKKNQRGAINPDKVSGVYNLRNENDEPSGDMKLTDEQIQDLMREDSIDEAGGAEFQHSSYRAQGKPDHGNLPQDPKTRWADDLDESGKPSKASKTIKKGMKPKKSTFQQKLKFQKTKKTSSGVHKRKP